MSDQPIDPGLLDEIIAAASVKKVGAKAVKIDRDRLAADVSRAIADFKQHLKIANVVRPKLEATVRERDSHRAKVQCAAADLSGLLLEGPAGGLQQNYTNRFWGSKKRLPPWSLLVGGIAALAELSRPTDRGPSPAQLMTPTDAFTWDLAEVFAGHFGNASVAPAGPFARFAETIAISARDKVGATSTTDGRTFARRLTALRQVYPSTGRRRSPAEPM